MLFVLKFEVEASNTPTVYRNLINGTRCEVGVNCRGYGDVSVEADNLVEAMQLARLELIDSVYTENGADEDFEISAVRFKRVICEVDGQHEEVWYWLDDPKTTLSLDEFPHTRSIRLH